MAELVKREDFQKLLTVRQLIDEMIELDEKVLANGGGFRQREFSSSQVGSINAVLRETRPHSLYIVGFEFDVSEVGDVVDVSVANTEATDIVLNAALGVKNSWESPMQTLTIPAEGEITFRFPIPVRLKEREVCFHFSGMMSALRDIHVQYCADQMLPPLPPEKKPRGFKENKK
ncbi:MAG: hypothetical protein ABI758_00645 [Candidatus Woesebacteria bacterium]